MALSVCREFGVHHPVRMHPFEQLRRAHFQEKLTALITQMDLMTYGSHFDRLHGMVRDICTSYQRTTQQIKQAGYRTV